METTKKLTLILAAILCVASASALLPDQTQAEAKGRSYFEDGGLTGYVDVGVYTWDAWTNDLGLDDPSSTETSYVYAYQVAINTGDIDHFTLSGMGDHTGDSLEVGNTEDPYWTGSVEPDFAGISLGAGTIANWAFNPGDMTSGTFSYYLLVCSDHGWTTGSYSFDPPDTDVTILPNPEPTSLALLGLGGLLLRKRRV